MRILLVRLDHMGDVVLSIPPAVHSLRASYPDARIEVLTTTVGRELLAADPAIDCIHTFDPPWSVPRSGGRLTRMVDWVARCRDCRRRLSVRRIQAFDHLFYFSFSPWERLLTFRLAPHRAGFVGPYRRLLARCSHRLLTRAEEFCTQTHLTDNVLKLVDAVLPLTSVVRQSQIHASADVVEHGASMLASAGLSPGNILAMHASTASSMKSWPIGNFFKLAAHLKRDAGLQPIMVGRREEIEYARREGSRFEGELPALIETPDIADFLGLVHHSSLFVGNDGGPMHVASAAGIPTVGVFGPTDERIYGPRGCASVVAREEGLCGRQHYPWHLPRCCRETGGACLRGIRVETVLSAAQRVLAQSLCPGGQAS